MELIRPTYSVILNIDKLYTIILDELLLTNNRITLPPHTSLSAFGGEKMQR